MPFLEHRLPYPSTICHKDAASFVEGGKEAAEHISIFAVSRNTAPGDDDQRLAAVLEYPRMARTTHQSQSSFSRRSPQVVWLLNSSICLFLLHPFSSSSCSGHSFIHLQMLLRVSRLGNEVLHCIKYEWSKSERVLIKKECQ